MNKYVVSYQLPYHHVVEVGVVATDDTQAIALCQKEFDEGTIWDDFPNRPLLLDAFIEDGDAGAPLEFKVTKTLSLNAPWPIHDESVDEQLRKDAAFESSRCLVHSMDNPDEGYGDFGQDMLNEAVRQARIATGQEPIERPKPNRIAIIVEGDHVQAVVCDRPDEIEVIHVDYTADGVNPKYLTTIPQGDGSEATANVAVYLAEHADIDLDAVFKQLV